MNQNSIDMMNEALLAGLENEKSQQILDEGYAMIGKFVNSHGHIPDEKFQAMKQSEKDTVNMILSNAIDMGSSEGGLVSVKAFDKLAEDLIKWKACHCSETDGKEEICECGHTRKQHDDVGGATDLVLGACGHCSCSRFEVKATDGKEEGEKNSHEELLKSIKEIKRANSRKWDRIKELEQENKRFKELLMRYRNETPAGHQPHMICHEVDAALKDNKEEV